MGSANKVVLVGQLTAAPESKYTQGGTAVATLSVETVEIRTNAAGDKVENRSTHKVIAWAKQAEAAAQYLDQGSPVCIEGKLVKRSWTDNNNKERWVVEVHAFAVQFLSDPNRQAQQQQQGSQQTAGGEENYSDDDIPF